MVAVFRIQCISGASSALDWPLAFLNDITGWCAFIKLSPGGSKWSNRLSLCLRIAPAKGSTSEGIQQFPLHSFRDTIWPKNGSHYMSRSLSAHSKVCRVSGFCYVVCEAEPHFVCIDVPFCGMVHDRTSSIGRERKIALTMEHSLLSCVLF